MDTYQELLDLVHDGSLLHGSQFFFNSAEPRKRSGLSKNAGKLKAVYTTDIVALALFKAVVDPKKVAPRNKKRVSVHNWKFLKNGEIQFWVSLNYIEQKAFSKGYIYVFEPKKFKKLKKLPHEFYSQRSLRPHKIIEVKPNDFLKKHKLVIWPKEDLIKSGKFTEEEIKLMGY